MAVRPTRNDVMYGNRASGWDRMIFDPAVYEGREFERLRRFDEPAVLSGITLRDCEFRSCDLAQCFDPAYPIRVSDVRVVGCSFFGNSVHRDLSESEHASFLAAATKFYAGVDWVLDISDAAFESAALFSLPENLIRRDPETQFLVRKERLLGVELSSSSRPVGPAGPPCLRINAWLGAVVSLVGGCR